MRKTLSKLVIEGNFLTQKKTAKKNPQVTIILNGESRSAIPIRSEIRSDLLFSLLIFKILPEANAV